LADKHLRCGPNVTHVHLPHGTAARFACFLRDLVRGAPIFEIEHVYALSGSLAPGGVDFIGRLESFGAEWRRLRAQLAIPERAGAFNLSLGKHDSSKDPTGDRAAAAAYLQSNEAALAALCLLLLPDFACLGYALPAACAAEVSRLAQDTQAARAAAQA
jgi:hypothetical protein